MKNNQTSLNLFNLFAIWAWFFSFTASATTHDWDDSWIETALQGQRSEQVKDLFAHESSLIEYHFENLGMGVFPYNPRFFRAPSQTAAKFDVIKSRLMSGSSLVRRARYLLVQTVFPLLDRYMPQLLIDAAREESSGKKAKHKKLPSELEKSIIRNFYFTEWTRELHGAPASEMTRFWLSATYPLYDAVFDANPEQERVYDRIQQLKRLSRIIAKDFDLPHPLLGSEKVMIQVIQQLDAHLPAQNRQLFFDQLWKLHVAQVEASIQKNFLVDDEKLRDVEFLKGGYTMHSFILMADRKFSQDELDLFFLEGILLQQIDDFLDIDSDFEEGVETLVARKLISPEEIWQMRDIVFALMTPLEEKGMFFGGKISLYLSSMDVFLHKATQKYAKTFGVDGPIEPRNLFKKKKAVVGGILAGAFKYTLGIPLRALTEEMFPILEELE